MITPSTNPKTSTPGNYPFDTLNSNSSSNNKDTKMFVKPKPLTNSIYRKRTHEHNQGSFTNPGRAIEVANIFEGGVKRIKRPSLLSGNLNDKGRPVFTAPNLSQPTDLAKNDQQKHHN